MDSKVFDEAHRFWFGPLTAFDDFPADKVSLWFGAPPEVDQDISRQFGAAAEAAADADIDAASLTPEQQVGLIVLLDQFPRNMHRGTALTYRFDGVAQKHARAITADGLERFRLVERPFLLLPFAHSEALADQDLALAFYRNDIEPHAPPGNRFYDACRIQSAKYRDIIARFGRFPHRNAILDRPSTAEEIAFLASAKLSPF